LLKQARERAEAQKKFNAERRKNQARPSQQQQNNNIKGNGIDMSDCKFLLLF
jgi:hypothetical protein